MNSATKRKPAEVEMTEDLTKRIQRAKLELNTALLTGEPTGTLRGALRTLEAEQAAVNAAAAREKAAQVDADNTERERIETAVAVLLEARQNRIQAIATRFAVPARA